MSLDIVEIFETAIRLAAIGLVLWLMVGAVAIAASVFAWLCNGGRNGN